MNIRINKNITYQNMWNSAKLRLREKFIALNAFIEKEKKPQISNVTFDLKKLQKEEQNKLKISRGNKIIKRRNH